jgi:hypothetical protein
MNFRIGQKVVCIDDKPSIVQGSLGLLKAGQVYTIRWLGDYMCPGTNEIQPHIRVEEIHRPCGDDTENIDTPYKARRFRPIVERKTNISIFKKMLTPTLEPV